MNNEYFVNAYPVFKNLLQTIDKNESENFGNILRNNLYLKSNKQLLNLLFFYCTKDNVLRPYFLSILINFGLEPNIIFEEPYKYINLKNKNNSDTSNNYNYRIGKSLLMFLCEKSSFSLVKELCEQNNKNVKPLNVNYYDKNGRNALFYLRGGNDDIQILDLLIKKGIDINKKDKDDNTALHILLLKTYNIKLISKLIKEGGANFMIKNKQGKTGLDLINEKYIQRINYNNIINDFEDIRKLIELLKQKLSIKSYPSNNLIDNNLETDNNNNYNRFNNNNNLIKLSSLSTSSTTTNSENSIENCHNIYVKPNPLSLIVDTQFNDNKNISSASKKNEYTQMNNNKKYLLNLLKQSENNITNMSKLIEEEIKLKKEKVKTLQNNIKEKEQNLNEMNNNFAKNINYLKNELNETRNILKEKKQSLLKEKGNDLFAINQNQNYLYKYTPLITQDLRNEYIYNQLQIDLIDFMTYVHKRNEQLQPILTKLNDLIEESVKNSLGEDYHLRMYGSRATKLCLPWSDIDYVISYNGNLIFEPLKILYDYLLGLNDKFYSDMKYIANATIPVLKIFSNNEYHKISLDISLENPEHHGEECVNYIKKKIVEYEVLTPLTFALKTILQKAFLNDPYKGGLSSYGVILLVIHFLDVQQKKGNDISIKSLGKLFYDILYYYGNEYDITNPIIVENEKNLQKIISIHQFQLMRGEFILIDPLNISNNVARNTRQYQNIKLAFRIGYDSIKENCECGCHFQYDEINVKEKECEHNLLNRIFNVVKRDMV